MEFSTLGGDYEIPRIVIGCWQLADDHGDGSVRSEARLDHLLGALADSGLDTFDMADIYTGVEARLGRFGQRWSRLGNSRRSLRLHTKLVPDLSGLEHFGSEQVREIVDRSRQRLGVEQLDLVQFHWWDFEIPGWVEAAEALAGLQSEGWIRKIGVTNFDAARLERLIDRGISIVSNQVQYSLLDRRPARQLSDFCRRHQISLLAYGSLAGGFLSEQWLDRPDAGTNLRNRSLVKYRLILDEFGGWESFQNLLNVLSSIAKRHDASIANIAMRWVLDQPQVAAVIAGISNLERTLQHRRLFTIRLDPEDHRALNTVAGAGPRGSVYELERLPGGRHGEIMRTDLNRSNG